MMQVPASQSGAKLGSRQAISSLPKLRAYIAAGH